MGYTDDELNSIYDKTDGYCHLCGKKLSWTNYGQRGTKAAWHVDHSIALANGGTHHMNNLYPACISCNEEKGTYHKNTIRKRKDY
jgi:5-methylcytosine-specific restriction endonuclease McrA